MVSSSMLLATAQCRSPWMDPRWYHTYNYSVCPTVLTPSWKYSSSACIKEGQSIWSKRRHGFQPCFEAGIRELPFLMPEPAEKSSLHVCNQCKNLYINSRHAHLVTHAYVHCHLNDCLCKQQVGSLLNNITKTCMQSMHEPIPI